MAGDNVERIERVARELADLFSGQSWDSLTDFARQQWHLEAAAILSKGERPLWGPEGPAEGQVIALRDIPGVRVRWTGGRWTIVDE